MRLYYAEVLKPRKACAVARHLNAPVEYVRVDLGRGEQQANDFRARNPNAKVPMLEAEGRTIWESNAIMVWLARRAGSDLWPQDERQIDVVRWLSWDDQHFTFHAGRLYFEHIVKEMFGIGAPDSAACEAALGQFRRYAAVLDAHLEGRDYVVGEGLTVADFALSVTLPYADKAEIPYRDYKNIARWAERLADLPAWRAPFPQQPASQAAE